MSQVKEKCQDDDLEFGSIRDRLMKARCRLLTIEPFYGTMCVNITWVPSENSPTIGVRMIRGGEIEALYNVEFCEQFDVPTLMAIIKHEIEHIVRLHMVRMGSEREHKQWNVACDMVVNGRESHPRVENLPKDDRFKGFYLPDKVDEKSSAEEVYKWLIDNAIKINVTCPLCGNGSKSKGKDENQGGGSGKSKGKDKDKGQSGGNSDDQDDQEQQGGGGACPMCGGAENQKGADISGTFIDDHSVWQDSTVSKDEARQIVKDMVDSAVRRAGTTPGHLIEVLKKLEKPIVNWKTQFRQVVGRKCGGHRRTFARRSRRYNHFGVPGKSSHARTPLTICVDTSGSMSSKDLERVFTEVESMSQYFVITVIQFDHGVQKVEKYHRGDWRKIEVQGRGGTSFIELIKWMKDNQAVGKLNIILTDGYAPFPEPQDFHVLWAIINKEVKAPWGDTIAVVKE